ncbi:MAG: DNA repair protein RecO C-terminal domain-containing protein, partial [Paracraurococcus sp.]
FQGLVSLIGRLSQGNGAGAGALLPDYVRWEAELLGELGYGLDLGRCAVTGGVEDLIWVSPRTGRAVSAEAGAPWRDRLLPLPPYLLGQSGREGPAAWLTGLRLTGHFLARDVFGDRPGGLPQARAMLEDRIAEMVAV